MKTSTDLVRCKWCTKDEIYIKYHDLEWGVPLHNDQKLFELLVLEGAQAGLSWLTVLKRRQSYRNAFNNFNISQVSRFGKTQINQLMTDSGIIRNRLKILSVIKNAQSMLRIQKEFGSFDNYLWQYVRNIPISHGDINNSLLDNSKNIASSLSKDLREQGMNFVGPTICYAFMQANGMVNDHSTNCFRYKQLFQK